MERGVLTMEPSGHSFARGTREVTLRRPSAAVTTYLLPLFFLFTTPLWAIPSPDLVVNFVASAAQVLGVLTLFLGGFAISSRKGVKSSGPASKGLRWSFRIAVTLLLVSLGANVFQYFSRIDATNCRLQTNLWRSSQEAGK